MTGTDLATTARPDTGAALQRQADGPMAAYFGRVLPELRIRIGSRTSPMAMAQAEIALEPGDETAGRELWAGDLLLFRQREEIVRGLARLLMDIV